MTSRLLSIDPGVHKSGGALFEDKILVNCWYSSNIELEDVSNRVRDVDHVVIEKPHYTTRRLVDPNDLIDLAIVVGCLQNVYVMHGSTCTLVKPHVWKGSTSKDVTHKKVLKALSVKEQHVANFGRFNKQEQHNVVDAVAIGLWLLRRLT